jgi:hypothetical protein
VIHPYAIGSFMDSANLQQNILIQLMSQQRPDSNSGSNTDYFSANFKPLPASSFTRMIFSWPMTQILVTNNTCHNAERNKKWTPY